MASKDMGLGPPPQRLDSRLNPQLLFQDEGTVRFSCGPPQRCVVVDPSSKATRELTGFIENHYFQPQSTEFRRAMYHVAPSGQDHQESHNWNGNGQTSTTPSGDGSEDEDDDEDDEVDEDDGDVDGLVDNNNKNNSGNNSGHSSATVDEIGIGKSKSLSSFGLSEGNILQSGNDNNDMRASTSQNHQQGRVGQYQNAIIVADGDADLYYSQYLQGQKDMVAENGCGFSGRKEVSYLNESGESLRTILSDSLTGALMDDAMILPCGHSFGSGGIQHVIRMKVCYTCSQAVSEDSVAPNLSLRAAVQSFRREEELQVNRASKRRKERYEQDKGSYGDSVLMDHPRGRGVQFPFVVTDRVIIKGNKRTPQRFVGREAVVTTQCLNGWYVVKTLDNAESVKLQYRSLAKVSDNPSSKAMSSKMTPNWL